MKAAALVYKLQKLGYNFRGSQKLSKKSYNKIVWELDYIKTAIIDPMFFRNKKEGK